MALGVIALFLFLELYIRFLAVVLRHYPDFRVPARCDALILCAGDSHTVGPPKGGGYPAQLEARLRAREPGRAYAVKNIGVSGYNTGQSVDLVRRFLAQTPRRPDLILFCAGFNNLTYPVLDPETDFAVLGSPGGWWARAVADSRAAMMLRLCWHRLTLRELNRIGDAAMHDHSLVTEGEDLAFLAAWVRHDLKELADLARTNGAKLALVTYWMPMNWVDRAYNEIARERGVPVLDVREFGYRRDSDEVARLITADMHPNERGYARIAELVESQLVARKLLPVAAPRAQAVSSHR